MFVYGESSVIESTSLGEEVSVFDARFCCHCADILTIFPLLCFVKNSMIVLSKYNKQLD